MTRDELINILESQYYDDASAWYDNPKNPVKLQLDKFFEPLLDLTKASSIFEMTDITDPAVYKIEFSDDREEFYMFLDPYHAMYLFEYDHTGRTEEQLKDDIKFEEPTSSRTTLKLDDSLDIPIDLNNSIDFEISEIESLVAMLILDIPLKKDYDVSILKNVYDNYNMINGNELDYIKYELTGDEQYIPESVAELFLF